MKTIRILVPAVILLAFTACNKENIESHMVSDQSGSIINKCNVSKSLKIGVISDLHFMDPSLLKADGTAFQMYLMQDPKLLAESDAILHQIVRKLLNEKPDLVLISGDLTKDGELVSHKSLLNQLRILRQNDIKVLVVPGNHDINNPDARQFDGDNANPVTTISAENFKELYADYGYKSAIARDPNSLSYVAEPFKDLRILALDANEYYNNTSTFCVVAGKIKDGTMEWAKSQIAAAKTKGVTLIGMMHHGLIEHFMGESVIFPDYLVEDWENKADELMQSGLKVIFTGHFHANDAIQRTSGSESIADIETGSAVIYHSPVRIMNLTNNKLYITTRNIDRIVYPGLTGNAFEDYEKYFSLKAFEVQAKYMLMNPPYNVPEQMASDIAPVFAAGMLAHFGGDEIMTPEVYEQIQSIAAISADLANIVYGLYTDLPPMDNDLIVDLN